MVIGVSAGEVCINPFIIGGVRIAAIEHAEELCDVAFAFGFLLRLSSAWSARDFVEYQSRELQLFLFGKGANRSLINLLNVCLHNVSTSLANDNPNASRSLRQLEFHHRLIHRVGTRGSQSRVPMRSQRARRVIAFGSGGCSGRV